MAERMDTAGRGSGVLSSVEIDAIGEILNISMGSAATAISTMLDKQVVITTPTVEVQEFHSVSYAALEPAILVKIKYVEGISGNNVMVFRQSDMQVILNLLMGNDEPPSDEFVFDEMSMSAACEVMNQMMGAAATALSSFLGKTINISTPEAIVLESESTFQEALGLNLNDEIVSVTFELDISNVMKSEFISVMTCELAKSLVDQSMGKSGIPEESRQPAPPAAPAAPAPQAAAQPAVQPAMPQAVPPPAAPPPGYDGPQPPMQQAPPGYPPMQPPYPMPQGYPPEWQQYGVPGMMPPYGYPPYGYPMPPQPESAQQQPGAVLKQAETVNIQSPKFPSFAGQPAPVFSAPVNGSNMELMMNVPLSVSVEIGKTKKKIRDIMDFVQGTVIELEKQAGAPVDIVVNGQLIARGDVVVVEDNFGVRITEIVGTKDLVDSLENND